MGEPPEFVDWLRARAALCRDAVVDPRLLRAANEIERLKMDKTDVILKMRDDIDALAEIVDALADTLAKEHPVYLFTGMPVRDEKAALKNIAERARRLYQKLMEE